jgi:hypothetical protein
VRIPYDAPIAVGRERLDLGPEITAAILLTVIAGWSYAITFSDVNVSAGEVTITERLRDGMRIELKTPDHPWGKSLMVLPGTESRSGPTVVVPDGRTDIPLAVVEVFLRTQEDAPHAIIECKRIVGNDTHLCREYVVEGIDRFSTGKYGGDHGIGFMVGYVLAGSAEAAATGINGYLTRAKRLSERLAIRTLSSEKVAWLSQHERPSASSPIALHHLLLAVAAPVT